MILCTRYVCNPQDSTRNALQGDLLHPGEGVGRVVDLSCPQSHNEAVGNKLDVPLHEVCIHANEVAGQALADKLALDVYSLCDNLLQYAVL